MADDANVSNDLQCLMSHKNVIVWVLLCVWQYVTYKEVQALCNDMQHPAPHIRVSAANGIDPLTDADIDYDDIKTT